MCVGFERIGGVLDSHPTLVTDCPDLLLSELTISDADCYFSVLDHNRDHLSRFGDYQQEKSATLDWVIDYFTNPPDNNIRYGLRLDRKLVGRVDLNPVAPPRYTIGYWLDRNHTGRGYATIACSAAIEYARTALGATDIFAGVGHGNDDSARVLQRLGFQPIAEFASYRRYHLGVSPV